VTKFPPGEPLGAFGEVVLFECSKRKTRHTARRGLRTKRRAHSAACVSYVGGRTCRARWERMRPPAFSRPPAAAATLRTSMASCASRVCRHLLRGLEPQPAPLPRFCLLGRGPKGISPSVPREAQRPPLFAPTKACSPPAADGTSDALAEWPGARPANTPAACRTRNIKVDASPYRRSDDELSARQEQRSPAAPACSSLFRIRTKPAQHRRQRRAPEHGPSSRVLARRQAQWTGQGPMTLPPSSIALFLQNS
jgi:hypothetical protein